MATIESFQNIIFSRHYFVTSPPPQKKMHSANISAHNKLHSIFRSNACHCRPVPDEYIPALQRLQLEAAAAVPAMNYQSEFPCSRAQINMQSRSCE